MNPEPAMVTSAKNRRVPVLKDERESCELIPVRVVPVAHKQSEDFVSLVEMFKETAFCEFFSSIRDGAGRIRVSVGDDQSVAYRGDGRGLVPLKHY